MMQAHPFVPIADNVKIAIAIFSYLGQLSFGITADSSAAPDLDILVRGIRRGLAELHTRRATARRASASGTPRHIAEPLAAPCARCIMAALPGGFLSGAHAASQRQQAGGRVPA